MATDYLPGFERLKLNTGDVDINVLRGGNGKEAVLLLHGNPETHLMWHKIAPKLADHYTVVLTDLRGYGDSSKPKGLPDHSNYSKREMGRDQAVVMKQLGYENYYLAGHDRGARVSHRMVIDYPNRIKKCIIMDIIPTYDMYAKTDKDFATSYWHWFFLIQPYDLPERLFGADPSYILRTMLKRAISPQKYDASFPEDVVKEYERHYHNPDHLHAVCEDYRAGATIDLEHDLSDRAKIIEIPLLIMWGKSGGDPKRHTVVSRRDFLGIWKERASNVTGLGVENCGHFIPEEEPEATYDAFINFFK
jgi:haloacetate dehalogenase